MKYFFLLFFQREEHLSQENDLVELEEEDFSPDCPQCGRISKDSRFCPYCGQDKAEEETFSDQQIALAESKKYEKLHDERLGRVFFLLLAIPLLAWGKTFFLPYGELFYFLLLGYFGFVLSFTEHDFRHYLLKRPKLRSAIFCFLLGLGLGTLQFVGFKGLKMEVSLSFWTVVYFLGTVAFVWPLLLWGILLPTLIKLQMPSKMAHSFTILVYTCCAWTFLGKATPFFFVIGLTWTQLRNQTLSLQTVFIASFSLELSFLLLTFFVPL